MRETRGNMSTNIERLEELWSGNFGDAYVERNLKVSAGRKSFWDMLLSELPINSVLEVGCNIGANIQWIAQKLPRKNIFGVDINEKSLQIARTHNEHTNILWGQARDLPFRDNWFDLTFTTGVLIHQPLEILPVVMREVFRCSKRYILCGEYYADQLTEIHYRGQAGALFKQNYGELYLGLFPELKLIKKGFLPKEEGGWDDVTYWIFEK